MARVVFVCILLALVVVNAFEHEESHHRYKTGPAMAPPEGDAEWMVSPDAAAASTAKPITCAQLRSALGMTATSTTDGSGKVIGIIDAGGGSTAESDLGVWTSRYSLPACTTANGCFRKVDQTGGTNYPADITSWNTEIALDVQSAHCIAPAAKKILCVAKTNSNTDLYACIPTLIRLGATYISMSWGGAEPSAASISSMDTYFSNATISFFAATGDSGSAGGIIYPSSSSKVIGCGGTTVYTNSDGTFASEVGWADSGGGCSAHVTAPAVQAATVGYACTGSKRSIPDVSALADPNSGLIGYCSSTGSCTAPNCYYSFGGTSLATPIIASRSAVRKAVVNIAYVYSAAITYRDITSGSNGAHSCTVGLDEVTGRGTWIGTN